MNIKMFMIATSALLSGYVLLSVSGCADKQTDVAQTEVEVPQPQLPISLNEVMVALVNQAADPIWIASWQNPETDRDWRNLEYLGYQLEVAGALLKIPGTGPFDKEWVARPRWAEFSDELRAAGTMAKLAADQKDLVALNKAGDAIVEVCEACHIEYKLVLPTGGIFGELSPVPNNP